LNGRSILSYEPKGSLTEEIPVKTRTALASAVCALALVGALVAACSSDATVTDAGTTADASTPQDGSTSTPSDASATPDTATPPRDAAVPPPGPTEFPAYEGSFVVYANGGKFFGFKEVAKDPDTDASKVTGTVYTAFFNDSGSRFIVTLPNATAGTYDLSPTVKVEVTVVSGAERAEGALANGKIEVAEAGAKKLKARFYGDVGGVKVHGAVDATLVP